MIVMVKLFAVAKQLAGEDQVVLELPQPATVADVRRALLAAVPALEPVARQVLFAVDTQYATDATEVGPESEIACIPPVSGG